MHAWEQIQETIEFIENHLGEELNIDALAKMASLSPFYYQRLFSRLVKKPAAEYIRLRRMARATEELLNRDQRILDVALSLGFSSHEHFTRTFKDTFGMTPEAYRAHPVALNRMTKPELALNYVLIDEGVPLITDGIVLEMNRRSLTEDVRFIGFDKKLPFEYLSGLGTKSGVDPLDALWRDLHARKATDPAFAIDAEELGVTHISDEAGYFCYFAGARTDADAAEGFVPWLLPRGEYIVCAFEAERFEALVMDALYKANQYVYDVWLKKHSIKTEPFCAERYPSHSPETTGMELWLKIAK